MRKLPKVKIKLNFSKPKKDEEKPRRELPKQRVEKTAENLEKKPVVKTEHTKILKEKIQDLPRETEEQLEIPKFVFKRLVDKKLTIILIENTIEVAKESEKVKKIIKSFLSAGMINIIYYGDVIEKCEICDVSTFNYINFQCDEKVGNNACLSDVLVELKNLVSEEYMKMTENEKERIRINAIDIIGIGTCKDNCSKVPKEVGIDCFCEIASKPRIVTKYFCLTEETFMQAAEIGFRSIGAISRNY